MKKLIKALLKKYPSKKGIPQVLAKLNGLKADLKQIIEDETIAQKAISIELAQLENRQAQSSDNMQEAGNYLHLFDVNR